MIRIILSLCLALSLSSFARAQTLEVAPEPGIEVVIRQQIEAFRADDFATAFEFASPNIQGIFRTPERFGQMVTSGYPMVYRPSEVQFQELRQIDGALWQKIVVRDASGAYHALDYQMIRGADGAWEINGVQLLQAPQLGA